VTPSWLQPALTIIPLLGAMLIAYFKNLDVLRKEITGSETRLRTELQGSEERLRARIDGVRDEVHKLDVRLAVLEDRHERGRTSVPRPAPAG